MSRSSRPSASCWDRDRREPLVTETGANDLAVGRRIEARLGRVKDAVTSYDGKVVIRTEWGSAGAKHLRDTAVGKLEPERERVVGARAHGAPAVDAVGFESPQGSGNRDHLSKPGVEAVDVVRTESEKKAGSGGSGVACATIATRPEERAASTILAAEGRS